MPDEIECCIMLHEIHLREHANFFEINLRYKSWLDSIKQGQTR